MYASEFNEGNKDAIRALHAVLLAVRGFDFVPENLRSTTFVGAAARVIQAHQGMNNFYNEPAPMAELAALGTSIPSPAFATCMTAVLCVKLGNSYGVSFLAQDSADEVLSRVSKERWIYYLDEKLEVDRIILPKLTGTAPCQRWMELIKSIEIDAKSLQSKSARDLVRASIEQKTDRVEAIALKMWRSAMA